MATENKFNRHRIANQKISIPTKLTTEKWQLEYLNFTNQTYFWSFFNGGKVECVESMLFDARG